MDNIVDTLTKFSNKHNLWTLTEKHVLEAIDNCLTDDRELGFDPFPNLTSKNFVFGRKTQVLIFNSFEHKTFIIRTTLQVYTDQGDDSATVGTYSLDVNENGEISDDSLDFY